MTANRNSKKATFENDSVKIANVSMDSGTSMINDIIKQIA